MNFREWVSIYYGVHRRLDLKENTIRSYLYVLRHVPEDWDYDDLSVTDIQSLVNDLSAEGLSVSTVKHVFTVIRRPLIDGLFYGLPDKRSAVVGVRLPRKLPQNITALSPEQAQRLLSAPVSLIADTAKLLLLTGLRFGELAALEARDIDLKSGFISVTKSFYNGKLTEPKTHCSIRRVPICNDAAVIIRRHISFGRSPLLQNIAGNRLNYRSCLKRFNALCFDLGLKPFGFHVLRHTFATELFRHGVSLKVISGLLGHSSVSITADIYTDLPFEMCTRAVKNLYKTVDFNETSL